MARKAVNADWYDYPQYYDLAFRSETVPEADFIEAACRKYCTGECAGCSSRRVERDVL